jgi:hypothetical protein
MPGSPALLGGTQGRSGSLLCGGKGLDPLVLRKAPFPVPQVYTTFVSSHIGNVIPFLICAKSRSRSPRFDTSPCTPVTFFPITFYGRSQFRIATPRYEDVCAFVHKLLRYFQCSVNRIKDRFQFEQASR